MEHKKEYYSKICGSYGNINGNNYDFFLRIFEDICGYHGDHVTMRIISGFSSDRTV